MPTPLPTEIEKLLQLSREETGELRSTALASLERVLRELASKQDKYEDLLNTFFVLANAEGREQMTKAIIKSAMRITEAETATYFVYRPETGKLLFSSLAGATSDKLQSLEIPADQGIVGKVVRTAEPLIINNVAAEPLFNKKVDEESGFTTRSILCVPVLSRDKKIIGAIEAINKTAGGFTEEDRNLLALLAANVAVADKLTNS